MRSASQDVRLALHRFDVTAARMEQQVAEAVSAITLALQGWVKSEHTFVNRSGDLQASIRGEAAIIAPGIVRGFLSAGESAPYAWALELAHDKKWAFLWPTIENHLDDIQDLLYQHLKRGRIR